MKIILGSASPRRKDLLSDIISDFTIIIPEIDENPLKNETPQNYVKRMALEKTENVLKIAESADTPSLIITCDTTVTLSGNIIGKPVNYDEAVEMISILSGKTHSVISGLALLYMNGGLQKISSGIETSRVTFRSLSFNQIEAYLSKIEYTDKAGSYAFQSYPEMIIDRIEGSPSNIIGLPIRLLLRMLMEENLYPLNEF